MYNKMAVLGSYDSVSAFISVGVEVFDCTDAKDATALIKQLGRSGYAVIFIAETLAEQIPDTLAKAKASPYPVIVAIPVSKNSTGYGMRSIKKDVEKAIGADILFNKN